MSTINKNNVSQTLFRFATIRNPQLSNPDNKKRRFIFRDYSTQKGVIDPRVEAGESLQKVCGGISGLTIATEQSLKTLYPAFYDMAVWVARNKSTATKEEFDAKLNEYTNAQNKPVSIDSVIWDNLIYQVVTQKDFYVKEILIQFLHLHHILSNYKTSVSDVDTYQDVIAAKVVLPKELFKVGASNTSTDMLALRGEIKEEDIPQALLDHKNMKFTEASIDLQAGKELSEMLNKLEKSYQKEYQKAYHEAHEAHQREIRPLLKKYQNGLEENKDKKTAIESRIKYLTDFSTTSPDLFNKNPELRIELDNLNKELLELYVALPILPEFKFDFKPEVSSSELEKSLNDDHKQVLNRVFGSGSVDEALKGMTSFTEINQAVTQNNQQLQQTVLNNTTIDQQYSTVIGAAVIPVITGVNNTGGIAFTVRTKSVLLGAHSVVVATDLNAPKYIVSGNYRLKNSSQQVIVSSTVVGRNTGPNITPIFSSPTIPKATLEKLDVLHLEGDVKLNDGLTYAMQGKLTVTGDEAAKFQGTGTFILKGLVPVDPSNPGVPGNPETPKGPFIPSGFGMKNIGVADYLKVEQSLQGYVEGEVAHIENVMARERREKSTKKTSKSEITTVESSDSEKEQLRDTSTTERFEMQSEIARALSETRDVNASAFVNGNFGSVNYGASGGFSSHNSKEEHAKQAVTQAKEITQKATDKIVTKVHKERTEKMIEEFEETNIHEFDNRKGDQHVVGVYRWVDKVYKNQIYNYGKRMMFEFMIPEPAKLHSLGMKMIKNAENLLLKPVDPRESNVHKLDNFSSLSDDTKLKYWLSKYNIELEEEIKPETMYIGKSFSFKAAEIVDDRYERYADNAEVEIEEGYETVNVSATSAESWDDPYYETIMIRVGDQKVLKTVVDIPGFRKSVPVSYSAMGHLSGNLSVKIKLKLTDDEKTKQRQKLFNKIITAYEKEKQQYEQNLTSIKEKGATIIGSNPGYYRQIENTILKRNCISYMLEQNPQADLTFGKNRYHKTDNLAESFLNTEIKLDSQLDQYTAFVKFMEQAFEWDIMSYYFYPYYWGNRERWNELYQFDDNDPTFKEFMQSGMARVIVTVRPGFEDAVKHFLATGQIWNGGEVPVIDDPMFLSIVDEMRKTEGEKYGKAWPSRLPTALTILQAQTIGLNVTKALPFDEDLSDFENAETVPQSSQLNITDAKLGTGNGSGTATLAGRIDGSNTYDIKILVKNKEGFIKDFTYTNENGDWRITGLAPGKYELIIDANDDLPDDRYEFVEGERRQEIEISEGSFLEINVSVMSRYK
ncbi:carboxypeptidase-like regulatory domain-containing protein [Chryseobacterium lactis]|uniref:carboxypeptidase-like regulatory domain-containing protein n=1 Tax=Chryseobacterium lactis TaxID=1241981 RepID=UPI001625249B|nr:carboxypeptidase-like regulatory domain-containing protein [Chryseobacterium lactis]